MSEDSAAGQGDQQIITYDDLLAQPDMHPALLPHIERLRSRDEALGRLSASAVHNELPEDPDPVTALPEASSRPAVHEAVPRETQPGSYRYYFERIAANDRARGFNEGEGLAASLQRLCDRLYSGVPFVQENGYKQHFPIDQRQPLTRSEDPRVQRMLATISSALLTAQEADQNRERPIGVIWNRTRTALTREVRDLSRVRRRGSVSAELSAAIEDAVAAQLCLEGAVRVMPDKGATYETDVLFPYTSIMELGVDREAAIVNRKNYAAGMVVALDPEPDEPPIPAGEASYVALADHVTHSIRFTELRTGRHWQPDSGDQFGEPYAPATTKEQWVKYFESVRHEPGPYSWVLRSFKEQLAPDTPFTDQDARLLCEVGGSDGLTVLKTNINMFVGLSREMAEKLLEADYPNAVYFNLGHFQPGTISREMIARTPWNLSAMRVDEMDIFDFPPDEELAKMYLEQSLEMDLAATLPAFSGLSRQTMVCLVETGGLRRVVASLESFEDPDRQWLLECLLDKAEVATIINHNDVLGTDLNEALVYRIVEKGGARRLLGSDYLSLFDRLSADTARRIVESDNSLIYKVIEGRKYFNGLSDGLLLELCRQIDKVDALPPEAADRLNVRQEYVDSLERLFFRMVSAPDNTAPAADFLLYMEELNNLPFPERSELTALALKVFGRNITCELLQGTKSLLAGELPPELEVLGVTETGEAGLHQLHDVIQDTLDEVGRIEVSLPYLQKIKASPILKGMLMQASRYHEAGWGQHDQPTFDSMLEYRIGLDQAGVVTPMPEEYRPSRIFEIGLLKKSGTKAEWTVDALERFTILRQELTEAALLPSQGGGMNVLIDKLRDDVTDLVGQLNIRLGDDRLPPKARTGIEQRRDALLRLVIAPDPGKPNQYPLRSLSVFEENFRTLAVSKELHGPMRTLMFAWALRKNPDWLRMHPNMLEAGSPGVDDVADMRQFIEKIVNQETFAGYFTDRKAADIFKEMVNTKALETGLLRQQGVGVGKRTMSMQFIPTRGIMMELSGHIADACWANHYDSVAQRKPNMMAVIMKQRVGTVHEKLAGAGMLIETHDASTGEPMLVIRGLNPLENTINHISVSQFLDAFVTYARGIATDRGMKLGMVIDDSCGGAGTNRPVLHNFIIDQVEPHLKQVEVDGRDTEFNGYRIVSKVYELDRGIIQS